MKRAAALSWLALARDSEDLNVNDRVSGVTGMNRQRGEPPRLALPFTRK